jgi:hypothetical protein
MRQRTDVPRELLVHAEFMQRRPSLRKISERRAKSLRFKPCPRHDLLSGLQDNRGLQELCQHELSACSGWLRNSMLDRYHRRPVHDRDGLRQ